MENNDMHNIWKSIDSGISPKSKAELNALLISKIWKTINKFLYIIGISVFFSAGLLIFLTVTALNRKDDLPYLINNATLGIVTVISLVSGFISWHNLNKNKFNEPLKSWLERRIKVLTKWLTGRNSKLYIVIIPFIYIPAILSIHVFYEHKPFIEVLKTGESVYGLIAGTVAGLIVAYVAVRKIRKYQLHQLGSLQEVYDRLCQPE